MSRHLFQNLHFLILILNLSILLFVKESVTFFVTDFSHLICRASCFYLCFRGWSLQGQRSWDSSIENHWSNTLIQTKQKHSYQKKRCVKLMHLPHSWGVPVPSYNHYLWEVGRKQTHTHAKIAFYSYQQVYFDK